MGLIYDRKSYEESRNVWLWVAERMAAFFRPKRKLDNIDHVALQVHDIAAAAAWYREHWKCDVEHLDATWAMLRFANTRLALVLPNQHPPHVAFLDKHPEKAGEPTVHHRDGTISVYIQDPWGNKLELLMRP